VPQPSSHVCNQSRPKACTITTGREGVVSDAVGVGVIVWVRGAAVGAGKWQRCGVGSVQVRCACKMRSGK